jgi:hypothetical protein
MILRGAAGRTELDNRQSSVPLEPLAAALTHRHGDGLQVPDHA